MYSFMNMHRLEAGRRGGLVTHGRYCWFSDRLLEHHGASIASKLLLGRRYGRATRKGRGRGAVRAGGSQARGRLEGIMERWWPFIHGHCVRHTYIEPSVEATVGPSVIVVRGLSDRWKSDIGGSVRVFTRG